MPGMNSGLSPANPALVAAFRSALLHQGAIALILIAFLWLAWATARTWRLTAAGTKPEAGNLTAGAAARGRRSGHSGEARNRRSPPARMPEPAGRRLLRIGFGTIWILDGLSAGAAEDGGRAGPAGHPADRAVLTRPGCSTWSTGAGPSGPTTPSRPVGRRCGSRPVSAPGSSSRRAGRGPGWPGWPAWPGGSRYGCSGSHSAASSRPA